MKNCLDCDYFDSAICIHCIGIDRDGNPIFNFDRLNNNSELNNQQSKYHNIMATKTCKNGHAYDASIYGQNCPFCPQEDGTEKTKVNSGNGFEDPTLPNSSWGQNNPTDPTKPTVPITKKRCYWHYPSCCRS